MSCEDLRGLQCVTEGRRSCRPSRINQENTPTSLQEPLTSPLPREHYASARASLAAARFCVECLRPYLPLLCTHGRGWGRGSSFARAARFPGFAPLPRPLPRVLGRGRQQLVMHNVPEYGERSNYFASSTSTQSGSFSVAGGLNSDDPSFPITSSIGLLAPVRGSNQLPRTGLLRSFFMSTVTGLPEGM